METPYHTAEQPINWIFEPNQGFTQLPPFINSFGPIPSSNPLDLTQTQFLSREMAGFNTKPIQYKLPYIFIPPPQQNILEKRLDMGNTPPTSNNSIISPFNIPPPPPSKEAPFASPLNNSSKQKSDAEKSIVEDNGGSNPYKKSKDKTKILQLHSTDGEAKSMALWNNLVAVMTTLQHTIEELKPPKRRTTDEGFKDQQDIELFESSEDLNTSEEK